MSTDITTLGLAVDTSQVRKAKTDLDQMGSSADGAAKSGGTMEGSWTKVKGVLAGLALGATIVQLTKMADSMALMDARLRLSVGNAEDFAKAQQLVYDISQKSNVGLEETTALFTKLHEPVKRMGGTTKETGQIVQAFAASLRVGGASAQEAAGATMQFAQAMGSGKLQGDEFRSIAEASPRFMKAMADPQAIAEAERQRLVITAISGADLEMLVKKLYDIPKPVIDKLKTALEGD
jgi:tape measure domain-containing protein